MNIAINNKGDVIYIGTRFIRPNTFKNNNPKNVIAPKIIPITFIKVLLITLLIYILYEASDIIILV